MSGAPVYVIDDDDAVRESTRALLEAENYVVVDFAAGQDFLHHAPILCFGCVVLDIDMPGMTGLELLDHIRGAPLNLPVVITTGDRRPAIDVAAAQAQAVLLEKPYDANDFLSAVRNALAGARNIPR